ncbi:MAG: DUF4199 domain-containing protein [Sphingobacteriales bacterium]|nr:MAG: DUF4199 domain-containing protein [Sphingobacteriales bacterium]
MRKNILTFGVIAGLVVSVLMIISMVVQHGNDTFGEGSMIWGYANMIVAFAFIFVAVKNFRDKYNGGVVSFGKAFQIGLFISLIASTFYVITWLIYYYNFIPDFMDKYAAVMLKKAAEKGTSAAELQKQVAEIDSMKQMYKNPVNVILFTYVEVFPVGLVMSLIAAFVLRRKTINNQPGLPA